VAREVQQSVFVAGHAGMVGSAIVRRLQALGYGNIVTRSRAELDLTNQADVQAFFRDEKVDLVYLAAAKVGGIMANNSYPAEFIYQNLMIEANLIHGAHRAGVQQLLFLGSSCIYPKHAPQPMREDALLQGSLEATNEPYAIAKIAGIKLCESYNRQHGRDYRSVMPTNLYGPNDNFDLQTSHVLPALLRKVHQAKEAGEPTVTVWGTGTPRREFLHVDDLADAVVFATEHYHGEEHLNVGTGEDLSIRELAELICDVVDYEGELVFDTTYPDGTPRKLLDVTRLRTLGWKPNTALRDGITSTYEWFLDRPAAQ
jgi:GDP-L-fucose synthase